MRTALLALALLAGGAAAQTPPLDPTRTIPTPDLTEDEWFGAWGAAIGDAEGDTFRDLIVSGPLGSSPAEAGEIYLTSSA